MKEQEQRLRSLTMTVSGNYDRKVMPDWIRAMQRDINRVGGAAALYQAALLGAADSLLDELQIELREMLFHRKQEKAVLLPLTRICLDAACFRAMERERPGIRQLRREAITLLLEEDRMRLTHTPWGIVEEGWLLENAETGEAKFSPLQAIGDSCWKDYLAVLQSLDRDAVSAGDLVSAGMTLYRFIHQDGFADRLRGFTDLGMDEPGRDFGAGKEKDIRRLREETILTLTADTDSDGQRKNAEGQDALILSEEEMAQIGKSVEINYGRSYLTDREQKEIEETLCRGPHEGCHLHFTDGVGVNREGAASAYAGIVRERNQEWIGAHRALVEQSIRALTAAFANAAAQRQEKDTFPAQFGELRPERLWKLGRIADCKLFERSFSVTDSRFVVDILLDASGSQQERQGLVAVQGYVLSRALGQAGIPHRVMSFCTFGDYTVMRRYRDYPASSTEDGRILEYYASGNNRDGLAVQAAARELLRRPEEEKILILLSDGMPNDIIVSASRAKEQASYTGDSAVRDTALQVRSLRAKGIHIMGIFVGSDEALADEKLVFGSDFAHIRRIDDFAGAAARFLAGEIAGLD